MTKMIFLSLLSSSVLLYQ